MTEFKLLGGDNPAISPVGTMTEGIGFPLHQVEKSIAGGSVTVNTVEVLRAGSENTQQPSALDTPLQLEFGPAKTGDGVDVDDNGVFTVTEADEYTIRIRFMLGRTGNPDQSIIFARFLVNGVQYGTPVHSTLDDSADEIPATFEGTATLEVGDEITAEIIRDSAGGNFGGVFSRTCSIPSWGTSPSCLAVITKTIAIQTPTT